MKTIVRNFNQILNGILSYEHLLGLRSALSAFNINGDHLQQHHYRFQREDNMRAKHGKIAHYTARPQSPL